MFEPGPGVYLSITNEWVQRGGHLSWHLRVFPPVFISIGQICAQKNSLLTNKGWREEGEPLERNKNTLCGSKNYPYLHHGRDFSLDPPPPTSNSSQPSYVYLKFLGLWEPPTPRNFQFLLWGEYEYLLELNIVVTEQRFKKSLVLYIPRVTNINIIFYY